MKIAENLRKLRVASGITQTFIAKKVNISRQAYCNYEAGIREPDYNTLLKIAKILGVPVSAILDETDENTNLSSQNQIRMDSENWVLPTTPENKKANDTVDEPIFITLQSFYKELPVKDQQKMDRVLKTIFEEMFPKKDDNK